MAKILIVDDHPDSAREMEIDLRHDRGHDVVHADTGAAALKALAEKGNGIDLVLIEASMKGDRDAGFTLTKTIRQNGVRIPVVLHSLISPEEHRVGEMRDKSVAAGANGFVVKGSIEPLLAITDKQLGGLKR